MIEETLLQPASPNSFIPFSNIILFLALWLLFFSTPLFWMDYLQKDGCTVRLFNKTHSTPTTPTTPPTIHTTPKDLPIQKIAKKCQPCTFKPRNHLQNSSPRDVVLAFVSLINPYQQVHSCFQFIMSLRTTGCQAQLFVFMPEITKNQLVNPDFFAECSASIVVVNVMPPKKNYYAANVRYIEFYKWLRNKNGINRVMLTDMLDMMFQGDPFTEEIDPSRFHFVVEGVPLSRSQCNQQWATKSVDPAFGDPPFNVNLKNPICNCGFLVSGHEIMKIYLEEYYRRLEGKQVPVEFSYDQGLLNNLFYQGWFARKGIDVTIFEPTKSRYTFMAFFEYQTKGRLGEIKVIDLPEQYYLVIHGYNRSPSLMKNLAQTCDSKNLATF